MRSAVFILISIFLISGCAGPAYKQIFREKPAHNFKDYSSSQDTLFKAVIKTVLARKFIIEEEDEEKGFILAKRFFQKGKNTIVVLVQAKVTSFGKNISTLYINALETTEKVYVADRTRFFLFIIPLPYGGGKEAHKVKEGEKIIEDKGFYEDFFAAVDKEIVLLKSQGELEHKKGIEIKAVDESTKETELEDELQQDEKSEEAQVDNAPE